MFKPIVLNIGLRYTSAKRRNHFISFIALFSMLGIALGVTVLITVMSVMNGFDEQIRNRIFAMAPQVTINSLNGRIDDWQALTKKLQKQSHVRYVQPYVAGQGMLSSSLKQVQAVFVKGIHPESELHVSKLGEKIQEGKLASLTPRSYNIFMSELLADRLSVSLGEKITLLIPDAAITPAGVLPRFKRFTISGIFRAGKLDGNLAFINFTDAQKLYKLGGSVSGLRLKLDDLYSAGSVARELQAQLPAMYMVTTWMQNFGPLFEVLKMEKTMMFFILSLIILIAAFNLICTLVMVVSDKRSDIAILRTFGATPRDIQKIFMVQGALIGLIGTALGIVGGIALASNVTPIVDTIEKIFHVHFLSATFYWVDFLPSKIMWQDILHVCLVALCISFVATLYPSWRAARTQPAEALRYE